MAAAQPQVERREAAKVIPDSQDTPGSMASTDTELPMEIPKAVAQPRLEPSEETKATCKWKREQNRAERGKREREEAERQFQMQHKMRMRETLEEALWKATFRQN